MMFLLTAVRRLFACLGSERLQHASKCLRPIQVQ